MLGLNVIDTNWSALNYLGLALASLTYIVCCMAGSAMYVCCCMFNRQILLWLPTTILHTVVCISLHRAEMAVVCVRFALSLQFKVNVHMTETCNIKTPDHTRILSPFQASLDSNGITRSN